jgi:protein SCO1/2
VVLVDQEGRERRLYSDLLQGRVVVINLFFTSCEDSCPILTRNLVKVQDLLGPRLGPEVAMLSFSVDPETDTPERCKAFAAAHAARPGWYFLTGSRENVDTALRKLGQYVERREAHSNVVIIGNERTGLWKKAFGLAEPEELIRIVESVLEDQG